MLPREAGLEKSSFSHGHAASKLGMSGQGGPLLLLLPRCTHVGLEAREPQNSRDRAVCTYSLLHVSPAAVPNPELTPHKAGDTDPE